MYSGSDIFQYHRFCEPEDDTLRFSEHFLGTNLNRVGGSVLSNTELDVFTPLLFPFFQLKINPAILNNTTVTLSYQRRPRQHATGKRGSADLLPLFPGSEDGIFAPLRLSVIVGSSSCSSPSPQLMLINSEIHTSFGGLI